LGGLFIAYFLHGALVRMVIASDEDFRMSFSLDPLMLGFTFAVTLAAAVVFGLLPAWQITKIDAGIALKEQSRSATPGIARMRWGRMLVGLQLALSVPLLAAAGLLGRTVYNLQHIQLGYPAAHLLLVHVNSRAAGYDSAQSAVLFRRLIDEIRRIPRVKAASFSSNGVFSGSSSSNSIEVEGYTWRQDRNRDAELDVAGPDLFTSLGVPLLSGRDILASDRAGAPAVCVINEAFANRFFAKRNPIGMHVTSIDNSERTPYQIVGIVRNARTQTLREELKPEFYIAAAQLQSGLKRANFLIRTNAETAPVLAAVRRAFQRVDAALPIGSAHSLEERLASLTARDHTTAQLGAVFGVLALTLAAIGLYGVMSYSIARRTSEIAIRMALGARSVRIIAMILRETIGLVLAGLAVGAALAYAASRWIASQLYGIAPEDPFTLAIAIGVLLAAMSAAVYLPARRAAQLDPIAALRQE
jgi:putative ABC transport system permease protein